MNNSILVLIGGGIGSLFRYWISIATYMLLGRAFPYGTLAVNITGCFIIGFLSVMLVERFSSQAGLRALLLIGFLGGYTTFSSFSIETLNLFENSEIIKGLLNIFCNVWFCLIAVTFGVLLGRQL